MKCPNCGKEIVNDSIYCEFCGAQISKKRSKKSLWITLIVVFCVLISGIIIYNEYEAKQAAIAEAEWQAERARLAQIEAEKQATKAKLLTQGYVDLGLPSGTLWKDKNEAGGFYTYDQAVSKFSNQLPTYKQWVELIDSCQWTWTGTGYIVSGPNGNSIVLPAEGFRNCYGDEGFAGYGYYWSSILYSSEVPWRLYFSSREVSMNGDYRCSGHSVRLVQN